MKIIGEKLARLEMAKPGEEEVASAVPASEQHSQLRPQCDGRAGDLFGPEWHLGTFLAEIVGLSSGCAKE